jgi:manganese/zinc/iron transport system permease protein
VVALMIAPPASAYLLTDRLSRMLGLSALFGAISAVSGYWVAYLMDASIAGAMAMMAGVLFVLVFLFAPDRGLIAQSRRRAEQKVSFSVTLLAGHLLNHEGLPEEETENCVEHMHDHMRWSSEFAREIIQKAQKEGLVELKDGCHLHLTEPGRKRAIQGFMA